MTFLRNFSKLFTLNKNLNKVSTIPILKQSNFLSNLLFKANNKPSIVSNSIRYFSVSFSNKQNADQQRRNKKPLMLMDIPRILVPSLLDLVKIRLKVKFRMLQIDPNFSYNEFSKGALQAVVTVSNMISRGEFENLKGLVHDDAVEIVKKNYQQLSSSQKSLLPVNPNDVQVQVHYLFQEAKTESSLFVKMGLLFYVVPGFHEALEKSIFDPVQQIEMRKRFQQDMIVVDYRFVREYGKDTPSSWLISELNHWAIADHEEELMRK